MQNLQIIGRLGRDAQVMTSKNGKEFLTFTMANTKGKKNDQKTFWFDVVSFSPNNFSNLIQYLTKGSNVFVSGDYEDELYQGPDNVTRIRRRIYLEHIEFVSTGTASASGTTHNVSEEASSPKAAPVTMNVKKKDSAAPAPVEDDDDLPF